MKKPKKLTIAEVILNRYLKEYNEEMIDRLYSGYGCATTFGYKTQCEGNCRECFELNPSEFRETKEGTPGALKALCINCGIEYNPTEEGKRLFR